jgi:23S rRNA maturation-related 3'-5' exoribonuclease YhaM
MSITKEQVVKNAKKYFATGEKYGFMTEDLQNTLGTAFIGAPASTRTDLHNAYEGGLVLHLLTVTKYAVSLKAIVPNGEAISMESLIKVCCLHQIGKANLYVPNTSKWHNDRGMMYEFNDGLVSMHVGERSAHMAMSAGIELSEDEFQAIVNHDKSDDDKQAKYHSNTLAVILRQANELAIMEEKGQ